MDRLKLERKSSICKTSIILICKMKNRHAKLYRVKLIFDFSHKFFKFSYLIHSARIQELAAPNNWASSVNIALHCLVLFMHAEFGVELSEFSMVNHFIKIHSVGGLFPITDENWPANIEREIAQRSAGIRISLLFNEIELS